MGQAPETAEIKGPVIDDLKMRTYIELSEASGTPRNEAFGKASLGTDSQSSGFSLLSDGTLAALSLIRWRHDRGVRRLTIPVPPRLPRPTPPGAR
jgi:hypothetical protein